MTQEMRVPFCDPGEVFVRDAGSGGPVAMPLDEFLETTRLVLGLAQEAHGGSPRARSRQEVRW